MNEQSGEAPQRSQRQQSPQRQQEGHQNQPRGTGKKLLITGASGFLGWSICHQVQRQGWQVYGTCQTRSIEIPGVSMVSIDLTDYGAVQQLFASLQPDAVIHAAAMSQPNACQTEPELSHQINVIATQNLVGLSVDAAIPFVFTSSEQVFDGLNPPYRETDPVCPLNLYGMQKAIAEQAILDRHNHSAIVRLPLMFGATPHAPSFLQPFLDKLRSNQALQLFTDEIRTPVSSHTAAQGINLVLSQLIQFSAEQAPPEPTQANPLQKHDLQRNRLLHLGGKERISRYQFGLRLIEQLGLSSNLIQPCLQADMPMAAPRASDLSMDSSIAFQLGYEPQVIREELKDVLAFSPF